MTPSLIIEYQDRRGKPRFGWLLIGLAVLLAFSATSKQRLEREVMAVEAHLQGASRSADIPARSGKPDKAGDADFREAEEVARQLATPWHSLFRSVERAFTEEVALLSVQPDVQRRSITITGEAKEYGDILSFVTRLSGQAPLDAVHLIGNELKETDSQRPIVFTIAARWRMGQ